jgi:RND family efflux transporter MFP subunit
MAQTRWAGACFLTSLLLAGCEQSAAPVVKPKPPVVLYAHPVVREVTEYEDFTGRTDAVYSVEVRARCTGYLDKVHFKDGDEVKKDDLLFEIDPRPYQADLERAESTVKQGLARLTRLEFDNNRAQGLFRRGAIGKEEYDRITGDYAEAAAAVGIAKANRDLADLSLKFTKVTAPISGRLSRRLVDPGNLVQADQTPLTTIVSLDPMYVYFDIDERTLLRLRNLVKEGKLQTREQAEVRVLGALADEEGFPHAGTLNFSENRVDASTGTLRVRGILENPKIPGHANFRLLSPGLFMRVRLPIGKPYQALMVPEQALQTDQGRRFVYVINAKNEAISRGINKIGPLEGSLRVVEGGVSPGDRIIVSGLQRVKLGAVVDPKPADGTEESKKAATQTASSGNPVSPPASQVSAVITSRDRPGEPSPAGAATTPGSQRSR